MSTEHVDSTDIDVLLDEALALPAGEKLKGACAAMVRILPQEAEGTRRRAAVQAATGVRELLRAPEGAAATLARSVSAWLRLQEAALTGPISAFSHLDTADAVQAWAHAHAFAAPEGEEQNLSALKRGVRAHIVSCISAWCRAAPRSLFCHLPQLVGAFPPPKGRIAASQGALGGDIGRFPTRPRAKFSLLQIGLEDSALPIRVSAVQCTQALLLAAQEGRYLRLADETSGRGYAFTSLSVQVAQVLISIRAATAVGVEQTVQGPVKLALTYLDVAEVLITKVVKCKLKSPHRAILAPALNKAVNEAAPVVAVRAWELLKLLGEEPVRPSVAPQLLDETLESLSEKQDEGQHEGQDAWAFLTALVGLPVWTEAQQLRLLKQAERSSPAEGALRALWGTVQHRWPFSQASFARPALAAIESCLASSAPTESQQLAGQCAATLLLSYQIDTEQVMHSVRSLTITSRLPTVRGGVFHALGIEAQALLSAPSSPTAQRVLQEGWTILISHAKEVKGSLLSEPAHLEMAAQLTWAMANVLDGPIALDFPLLELLSGWIPLSERVGTNAARSTGILLSRLPVDDPTVGRALGALSLAVRTRTPKMRWNAAAAVQRALQAQGEKLAIHPELRELCGALESNLQAGGNAKVTRASAAALRAMPWALLEGKPRDTLAALRAGRRQLLDTSRTGTNAGAAHEALAELDLLEKAVERV